MAKAAASHEIARRQGNRNKQRASHDAEVRSVIRDIKRLLTRIEDAVPLINLAITTSGASLSTTLPATVSPSRMLQASTFLTAGDNEYRRNPGWPSQVGPTFTLSLYMLFAGHARPHDERELREMTWKETIHKAQVKLMRVPLEAVQDGVHHERGESVMESIEGDALVHFSAENKADEYAYQLVIVEDLDDDRVHTFEDGEPRPQKYEGVKLAGLRELLPIHQISKIFYADTGKILNIGSDGESNNPILLLKRDVFAQPPLSKMESSEREGLYQGENRHDPQKDFIGEDQQDYYTDESEAESEDPNDQLHRESSYVPHDSPHFKQAHIEQPIDNYGLPANLDREWFAFEVYQDPKDDEEEDHLSGASDSEDTTAGPRDSAYAAVQQTPPADDIAVDLSGLHLNADSNPASANSTPARERPRRSKPRVSPASDLFGSVRSSLSLLEMLIRLTALQQFEQALHLTIPDEILNFFLQESSTTGGNGAERRQTRNEARMKVGFDPYDESPIKRHGEDYQRGESPSSPVRSIRGDSAFQKHDNSLPLPGRVNRSRSSTPMSGRVDGGKEWLLRDREKGRTSDIGTASSPASPLPRRLTRPVDRATLKTKGMASPSPLGMGSEVPVGANSSLGTSPASAWSGGSGSGNKAGRNLERPHRAENDKVTITKEEYLKLMSAFQNSSLQD